MIRTLANMFGVVLLMLGILGLMPEVAPHGLLLKIFQVNTMLNLLHLFSGAAALWCGLSSALASRVYFRFFGTVYLLAGVVGFVVRHGLILGHISNNMADSWAHLGVAVLFLVLGFAPAQDSGAITGELI